MSRTNATQETRPSRRPSGRSATAYALTLGATVVCGALLTTLTRAQGPQGPGGPPPGPPGQGGFGPGQGRGPGRGGFGRMPFLSGRVTGGDVNAGILTVTPAFGGPPQTVRVTQATQFVTQKSVSVSDLQVNDEVDVRGVPTAITANSIMDGQMPAGLPGSDRAPGAPAGPGGPGVNSIQQAFAQAHGRVTSTSPLTISLSGDVSLVIKTTATTHIDKLTPTSLNQLKAGDTIIAGGTANQDGSFTANSVGVNLPPLVGFGPGPGMGPGMRPGRFGGPGGGFGGPGAGGPGAPPPPPGAPGPDGPPPTR